MEPAWLEVSLTVDGEMAEAVAEVLSRYAPGGVVMESTRIEPDPEGEGYPAGPLRVCAYLPVDEQLEDTRRQIEESLYFLSRAWPENPLPAPKFAPMQEVNWVETWKQHYKPIRVGRRLMITPTWIDPELGGRIPIRIEPGMAFGTGAHPTTQLCLEIIEDTLADRRFLSAAGPQVNVIDVGCGSSILSVAALKLGAAFALGVDIDPESVPVSRQNAEINGVLDKLEIGVGSVDEVRAGQFSIRTAPLVLANILAPILIRLLDSGLGELLSPGGVLVLSGVLAEQWEKDEGNTALRSALRRHGFGSTMVRQQGDWVAIAATRQ